MEVSCAMLAAYAEISPDGRVSMISGDLDTVRVRGSFPATLPTPLYLVITLAFPAAECEREYRTRVEIVGPDGAHLHQLEQTLFPPSPAPNQRTKTGAVVAFYALTFPMAGDYVIRIILGDEVIKRLPLRLELDSVQT
jgi:Family of unknown function (DUF6941)